MQRAFSWRYLDIFTLINYITFTFNNKDDVFTLQPLQSTQKTLLTFLFYKSLFTFDAWVCLNYALDKKKFAIMWQIVPTAALSEGFIVRFDLLWQIRLWHNIIMACR